MTKAKINLNAKTREIYGRKVKQLRQKGLIPANIYGHNIESLAVQVDSNDFLKAFEEAGETSIISLKVDGKKTRPVLITQIDYDPVSGEVLHVDLRQVNLKEKIAAYIPVVMVGDDHHIKTLGGVVVQSLDEVEVEALPTDFPEEIEINYDQLTEIGSMVSAGDLPLDKEVELLTDPDTVVVSVQEVKEEEEPEPETDEVVEAEVIPKGKEANAEADSESDETKSEE